MDYQKHYILLIETRKNRELDPDEYYEWHHIWPRCLAADKEEEKLLNQGWNSVYLTAREHFVAHWLLVKEAFKNGTKEEQHKLGCAFHRMCYGNEKTKRNFTSRQYEIARKLFSKSMQGKNNPFHGKTHSEESKQKMSKSSFGETHSKETKQKISEFNFGKNRSEETKQKISKSSFGKNFSRESRQKMSESKSGKNLSERTKQKISKSNLGKSHSEETRQKISESHSGKNLSEETKQKISESQKKQKIKCPHCGKEGGKSVMKRWHFNNCKRKKDDSSVVELFFVKE